MVLDTMRYLNSLEVVVLMLENDQTGLIWKLARECQAIRRGLFRAGFTRAWL